MLTVDGVSVRFGGLVAVKAVDVEVGEGEILGLIGPNGSGKTTLLNAICGVYPCDTGQVVLGDQRVDRLSPSKVAALGLMRAFQVPRVFTSLTVMENMLLPMVEGRGGRHRQGEATERAMGLLEFVNLANRHEEVASVLSGGQQKLLEFARALMTDPKVVLMDEPFAGVHPELIRTMTDRISRRRENGTSFIIVSHELPPLMKVSDQVICMNAGEVVCADKPEAVMNNEDVIAAYLGRSIGERSQAQRGGLDV